MYYWILLILWDVWPIQILYFVNHDRGGTGRSSGAWSADPQGHGIWFIFWYFGKLTKEGLFGRKIGKLSTRRQFKWNSEHFGAKKPPIFRYRCDTFASIFLWVNWQIRMLFHFEKIIVWEINICWSFAYFYEQLNRFHFCWYLFLLL